MATQKIHKDEPQRDKSHHVPTFIEPNTNERTNVERIRRMERWNKTMIKEQENEDTRKIHKD